MGEESVGEKYIGKKNESKIYIDENSLGEKFTGEKDMVE